MSGGRAFIVRADIRYLDGRLSGLLIPAGYRVTVPDRAHASRTARWLAKVRDTGDFVRAVGSGAKYAVVGPVNVDEMVLP